MRKNRIIFFLTLIGLISCDRQTGKPKCVPGMCCFDGPVGAFVEQISVGEYKTTSAPESLNIIAAKVETDSIVVTVKNLDGSIRTAIYKIISRDVLVP